jgi:O-antigen/teichoic acid export membrane protein
MRGPPALRGLYRFVAQFFGNASPLFLGRMASAALTFALPLVLVRVVSPTQFGLYKQFFLIGQTVLLAGQLGLTQSLFYFLARGGPARGAYVTQALAGLSVVGAAAGALVYFGIGRFEPGSGLMAIRLPLALFAGAALAASPLEGILISEGRNAGAAAATVASDALRASLLCAGALWRSGAGLFWAGALSSWLRLGAVLALCAYRILPTARPVASLLRAQLRYALPFAAAAALFVGQRSFAPYAVSIRFAPAVFALFAVATFHLPTVDIIFQPLADVLVVELAKTFGAGAVPDALAAWRKTVERLATILLPATACAFLFGPRLIVRLFTSTYRGAIPLFILATVEIPFWIFPVDALLRARAETGVLLRLNALRLCATAALVSLGLWRFGIRGALAGHLVAEALGRALLLSVSARRIGVPLGRLAPVGAIGARVAQSIAAAVPAWWALRAGGLAAGIGVYAALYLAFQIWGGRAQSPVEDHEQAVSTSCSLGLRPNTNTPATGPSTPLDSGNRIAEFGDSGHGPQ